MITTLDLGNLPDLRGFRRLTQSLAALDAILMRDWQYRYYSFDARWREGEMMASMRDGCGDHWFALHCEAGAALVGLSHEMPCWRPGRPMPWVFQDLPVEFRRNFLRQPAFDTGNCTFCIWHLASEGRWRSGRAESKEGREVEDGARGLLSILDGDPRRYVKFARQYFEVDVAIEDIDAVYRHAPMKAGLARRLNREVDLDALRIDLLAIGYPDGG